MGCQHFISTWIGGNFLILHQNQSCEPMGSTLALYHLSYMFVAPLEYVVMDYYAIYVLMTPEG